MDNNFYKILDIFKRLDENHPQGENSDWYDRDGNPDEFGAYDAAGHYHDEREDTDAGYDAYKEREWTEEGTPGTKLVGEETVELSLEEELMNEWDQFLKELGAPGVASATSSTAGSVATPAAPGATPAPSNPADDAKKKADIQKNLQGIPGVDASKAVTNLTDPKDDSGIDAAITKVLTDPATSQQAKQLLAKGMK
jgi:hypothetical protein